MSNDEERRVKARYNVTQFYQRMKLVSRRELPQADMTIEENPSLAREEEGSEDDDVKDDTYVPSPRAPFRGQGKCLASASGSGASRDEEIEEEAEEDDGDGEEEVFDVEEICPPSYVDMGPLMFKVPSNPTWRVKVSYKGKIESVREKRKINARTLPRDAYDCIFHSLFQHDFYESVVTPKSKRVANSQWIDWAYMENKHDPIFDRVMFPSSIESLLLARPST
jgi:hypothetical protein